MTWQSTPYTLALILTAALSALLAILIWQRRKAPGGSYGALVMAAMAIWSVGYALQVAGGDLPTKLFWSKFRYIGIVSLPPLFILFTLDYIEHNTWFRQGRRWLLFIIPAITLLLAFTNEWHGHIWYEPHLEQIAGIQQLVSGEGAWFWIHTVYSYTFVLGGVIVLLHGVISASPIYRRQRIGMTLGAIFPLLANIVTLGQLWRFGLADITPFAFLVTGIMMAWSLFRFHLLDLVPVARDRVFEGMSDGVMVLDRHDRVLDLNPAARRMLGLASHGIVGRPVSEVMPRWEQLAGEVDGAPAGMKDIVIEGEEGPRHYQVRLSPLEHPEVARSGRLLLLQDVSEQRRALAAIQRAREEAESASRAKSAFLANMSHELRTPLAAIIGYSELIQEEVEAEKDAELHHDIGRIHSAGMHLLALVNTVLDYSKIEAGEMKLHVAEFNVASLLDSVIGMLRTLVEQNGNKLIVQNPDASYQMFSDRTKVQQVLLNLLGNAAKFTENGTITLDVRHEQRAGVDWYHFSVADTGIGIDPDAAARLFQPFMQADTSTTRRYGGTGLGLAISQRFCQMMGGDIVLEWTAPGEGSRFMVSLPARIDASGRPLPGEAAPTASQAASQTLASDWHA